jgi:hypothetical protein
MSTRTRSAGSSSSDGDSPQVLPLSRGIDAQKAIQCVLSGDALSFELFFPDGATQPERESDARVLMESQHEVDGVHGDLVFFAAHRRRQPILARMATFPRLFSEIGASAAFRLLTLLKYNTVITMLRLCPDMASQRTTDGTASSLLHVACMRQRPSVEFIEHLLERKYSLVDAQDGRGWTALHHVAARTVGTEGRTIAKLLLQHGADRNHLAEDGKTPLLHCGNPQVRELLGEIHSPQGRRRLPSLEPSLQAEIDNSTIDNLPPIKPVIPMPDNNTTLLSTLHGTTPKKAKVISIEDAESLVQRLYHDSSVKKDRWLEEQTQKLDDAAASKKKIVSAEEWDETVNRLYGSELAAREEKRTATIAKYIREPTDEERERSLRSPSEVADAVARMTSGAMSSKETTHRKLTEKYAPRLEGPRLSAEEQTAAVARLYEESAKKTRETSLKLADRYLSPQKSRFSGEKKMTKDDWKIMGDRLASPKGS